MVLLREEHAAVDDQQLAAVFEHGHVAADLAEAAKGHNAHGSLGKLGRGSLLRCGLGVACCPGHAIRSLWRGAAGGNARCRTASGVVLWAGPSCDEPAACSAAAGRA